MLLCALLSLLFGGAVLSACGGAEPGSQFASEAQGEFPVEVIEAQFDPVQKVARTYDLTLAVRNSGDEKIPAISTTINLPGLGSTLAFAYRDRQKGLAQPQRPVWVMEEDYPKLAGTVGRGGAATASRRTFNFGELTPGETANMVWRVTAIRPGSYRVAWELSAGLGQNTRAVDSRGARPRGVLPVRINNRAQLTRVNDKGQVVPLSASEQLRIKQMENSP